MPSYQRLPVDWIIGSNSSDNRADTSKITQNYDGSVLERVEWGFGTLTRFSKPDVTQPVAWTTANSPVTIFTVTGTVLMWCFGVVTSSITSTGGTGTLALGVSTNTTLFTAATTANGTNFAAGHVWTTTTTTRGNVLQNTGNWALVNDTTVQLTVATNNMTAGGMTIYALWRAISVGATVT
jgi:protein-S-isoprenylcysteine O-methyltransferase Ste14